MSITQQLAHWLIALGLDPALSALASIMALGLLPLMVGVGIIALFEEDEDESAITIVKEARL